MPDDKPSSGRVLGRLMRQIGGWRLALAGVVLVMAVVLARGSWSLPLFLDAEHALFDARVVVSAPLVRQDSRIVIVPYTDDTLIATGKRSPLDRATLARALARLDTMGAKAIGIDIMIDQPQAEDPELIAAFRHMKTPTYLAYASSAVASEKINFRQQQFLDSFHKAIAGPNVHPASIVVNTDSDNVMRRWAEPLPGGPPRMPNALLPQAKAFTNFTGTIAWRRAALAEEPIFNIIPIDSFADDTIFATPGAGDLFAQQIKGRYVLIGGNIEDIDIFQTPLSRIAAKSEAHSMWGMELFAVMLAQMLDGRKPIAIPSAILWLVALGVVTAGGATAGFNQRQWLSGSILIAQPLLLLGLPFALNTLHIETYGLPAFGWVVGWFTAYLVVSVLARELSSEQRRFAQGALGKYLPRDIAAQIIRDPDSLQLRGEKRPIFVLFSDLEGFTKLSFAIPPELVASLLNRYLDMLSDVVLAHGGTIDKFVGDAVVAFWGAPISRPDDGRRCVEAAIAMHAAGEAFRASAPPEAPPIGRTRVGVHWGEAIVGNFGGEGRIQYTALGDSMNTASRLESANKQLGTSILISGPAVRRSGLTRFRPLGRVMLRGRASDIDVYEPMPEADEGDLATFDTLAGAAIAGDPAALAELKALAQARTQDKALDNLVQRLTNQKDAGYYVLD